MFIGHYAVGLASKRAAPRTSLGLLMFAPQLLDHLWPVFLLTGVEHVQIHPGDTRFTPLDFYDYPWSHSLAMSVFWGVLLGGIYFAMRRDRRGAIVLSLAVVSHWVLDWLTHRPDMPLYPGGPKYGLGLWNSPVATVVVEAAMFAAGLLLYATATRAVDRLGSIGLWSLAAVLLLFYAAAILGPPPPSTGVLAWSAMAMLLFPFWAWRIDRHRTADSR